VTFLGSIIRAYQSNPDAERARPLIGHFRQLRNHAALAPWQLRSACVRVTLFGRRQSGVIANPVVSS